MKTFDEYQEQAVRTSATKDAPTDTIILHCALGLGGESGEIIEHVKKVFFFNHDVDYNYLRYELGDVLWYIAVMADGMGMTLSELAKDNIQKLKERYPEGFDRERSKH
jgi:NTP pyrophosphatase (non-canonical NTP hydrolase)